jgi:hypothetical protein
VKKYWRDGVILALLAAFVLEFAINLIEGHTLWQRVKSLEQRVNDLEHPVVQP